MIYSFIQSSSDEHLVVLHTRLVFAMINKADINILICIPCAGVSESRALGSKGCVHFKFWQILINCFLKRCAS